MRHAKCKISMRYSTQMHFRKMYYHWMKVFLPIALIVVSSNAEKSYATKSHLESLPRVAPTLGESAIVDKESGRVYWQGGKQSLFDSTVGHTYLSDQDGVVRHVRASLFSFILWISFIRWLADWALHQQVLIAKWKTILHPFEKVIEIAKTLARVILLCLACLPNFGKTFISFVVVMYLLESYWCSTRKYLANAISSPESVESYMKQLSEQAPSIKWRIRCYHYEKRKLLSLLLLLDFLAYFRNKNDDIEIVSGPSIFNKKIVTHQAEQSYQYGEFNDETISSIWRQARAGTSIMADFTKISLHKLILFSDAKSRKDYFAQQAKFINKEGSKDTYAEFSTIVDVKGYKEKVLAVRESKGVSQVFSLKYFWLFTFIGLTVPYRIRFSNNCDELRVAIVKEVMSKDTSKRVESTTEKSWFPTSWFTKSDAQDAQGENFRKQMQEMSLYEREKIASELDSIISAKTQVDESVNPVNSTASSAENNSSANANTNDDENVDIDGS